ncbi:uncharacterized protein LOC126882000 isoform X2 [Diabrotica virgifera virgifera]|uniref:ZAD domain-containing protein n=1 Tax=Diabrotica virgifera virgifera TaxID=50390 RepID=A0ABM5JXQ8_DIAVI|nr:uncharacterized protein LOC126882000 isoform X2 [Diabrotica virgifera virgifera]
MFLKESDLAANVNHYNDNQEKIYMKKEHDLEKPSDTDKDEYVERYDDTEDEDDINENIQINFVQDESNDAPSQISHYNTRESQNRDSRVVTALCRLCLRLRSDLKNIFVEEIEEGVHIVFAILACVHPIEISYEDPLPKNICSDCLETLKICFNFRSTCLKNDKIQKRSLPKLLPKLLPKPQPVSATKRKKRKNVVSESDEMDSKAEEANNKKKRESVTETDGCAYDELEAISEFLVKKDNPNKENSKGKAVKAKGNSQKPLDSLEEELRKVLEGTLSEEQASAENIIIHIEDDDEEVSDDDGRSVTASDDVVTEEGSSTDLYKSTTGIFTGTSVSYLSDSEFCMVGQYLFEYRLVKGNLRKIRCLLPSCPAQGLQEKPEGSLTYNKEVHIYVAHNHSPPNEAEQTKQMFFYVMKRKMQSDKTLKFKHVYDDICARDPHIQKLIPLRNVVNEICRHQVPPHKTSPIQSFDELYNQIEDDSYYKLQFTNNGVQFFQEKFTSEDNAKAIVFANLETIQMLSESDLMYIDASFRIETDEPFCYQLVTVLVWVEHSYYPIMYAIVNYKTQDIYKKIFEYLHDQLAPKLRPDEIVTEYEANLYYALGEIYVDSSIGGSVFYFTQNIYKKICSLNLAKDLETNNFFRNIYHLLLMLPLLPVNTIVDAFNNIQTQAIDLKIESLTLDLFNHIQAEWIDKVTPDLFCVHRLENRINENVIAPFKKLRDYMMLTKGKTRRCADIITLIEKLIELENFLHITYSTPNKKSFARDLSSAQKKNVLKAWMFIENHPKINVHNFFSRVLGYIKCMENQMWIWGFYKYDGEPTEELINASNFSIIASEDLSQEDDQDITEVEEEIVEQDGDERPSILMEAVLDENGKYVLKPREEIEHQEMS